MVVSVEISVERWPIAGTFTISRGSKTEAAIVLCTLSDGTVTGRGECVPYAHYGESLDSVCAEIERLRERIGKWRYTRRFAGIDRCWRGPQCDRLRIVGPGGKTQRQSC